MNNVKVVTNNVRGIRDKRKRFTIINWLKSKDFDVICFQETFVSKEIVSDIEKDFHELGKYYASCTDSAHSRGVGILVSSKLDKWKVLSVHRDTEGRKILINIKNLNNEIFSISSFYAPNNLQPRIQFIMNCNEWLQNNAADTKNMIIVGDFNT